MTHSPALSAPGNGGGIIEQVITKGNLADLTPEERTRYYVEVCRSVGLNPLTKPFEYITLNGKLQLYALRGCTDQLRTSRGVSVDDMSETEREGVFVVTCKVRDKDGRTDMAKGAVSVSGLKGEALANAIMKAETKAKRRATLSLCGLGWLDESELETIAEARPLGAVAPAEKAPAATSTTTAPAAGRSSTGNPKVKPLPAPPPRDEVHDPETGEITGKPEIIAFANDWIDWGGKLVHEIIGEKDDERAQLWVLRNRARLDQCQLDAPKVHQRIMTNISMRLGPQAEFMTTPQ